MSAAPLAERSRPAGDTLFTKLTAEETGIVVPNPYDDPRMWGERYRELTFGAMGTGVAAGDFDNDGHPDLFVVSKTKTSRLFRNTGNWKFVDVTEAAGLVEAEASSLLGGLFGGADSDDLKPWEQGATWADINDDGWLDLYVCRHAAPNRLYVNQGDGTFVEEAEKRGLAVVDGSGVGAFSDYDRDGDLDVYVQTNMMDYALYPEGRPDYLFRNRGDGYFEDVTAAAGISGPTSGHAAMWSDYNDDGWPDIYVVNDFAPPDQMYQNNGDGTFTNIINEAVPLMPFYGMGADAADVDGDGTFDLFVADMAATTHEKDQRSMAGSRVRGQKHDEDSPVPPSYMRNHLLLNTGTGLFREAAHLAGLQATDWTWSVRWADFDLDGWVDLHVTNGMNREYHGADLLERIMISENPTEPIRIMQDSPVLAESNLAFRNRGELDFEEVTERWGLTEKGVSFGAATADFDGDGDLDLVYANYEGNPSVFRNDVQTGNRLVIELRGRESN
ncbi:MAG: FG-GAP repeat domain-containing protein, partial [Verrucomicrobiia bacterium]